MPADLNVADCPLCPHCQAPVDTGSVYGHFMGELTAAKRGLTLCERMMTILAYGDRWGWACAPHHTCYHCRTPRPPAPLETAS